MGYIKKQKPERKKVYKGFDFYEDQLETIEKLAVRLKKTKTSILRDIIDNALKLPKPKK